MFADGTLIEYCVERVSFGAVIGQLFFLVCKSFARSEFEDLTRTDGTRNPHGILYFLEESPVFP